MNLKNKIKKTIKVSKMVIKDCSLENGAIIAANTDKYYYPRQAKNYHFVWPRDAAYICIGAKTARINDIQEPFFKWLEERPEDFKKESKLYQNYSTNGRKSGKQFQPDQAGAILWTILEHFGEDVNKANKYETLIRRLADGLANEWKGGFFFSNTADLWEEGSRTTSTKMENNFTYTLAACAKGLLCADKVFKNEKWKEAADQMIELIDQAYSEEKKYFLRNQGKIDDFNVDVSTLGIVWPFGIIKPDDPRIIKTIKKIEDELVFAGGVKRFQFDYYDGEGTSGEGGGAWPICNFWISIYYSLKGDKHMAKHYFDWVIKRTEDDCMIAEQIFEDVREGGGIKPLAWSHAMFLVAAKYLGYLK